MTAELADVLIATAPVVEREGQALGSAFYRHLFQRLPNSEELFAFDLHQRMHLMPMALVQIATQRGPGVRQEAEAMRSAHRIFGVTRTDFEISKAAFAAAFAEVFVGELRPGDCAAWCSAYDRFAEYLADAAAPALRLVD